VIDTARAWFALPPDGPRLAVVQADAHEFVSRPDQRGRYGVVQVDLYDMHARGPVLESSAFYRACAAALASPGVCVVNLFGEADSYGRNVDRISRVFGGRVLELPAVDAGNRVVFGFQGPPLSVEWSEMERRAARLRAALRLPAREWVAALRTQRGGARFTI
jgi:spermidine synthase